MHRLIREYKGFSRRERRVLQIILWIIIGLLILRIWSSGRSSTPYFLSDQQRTEIDSFIDSFEKLPESQFEPKVPSGTKKRKVLEYHFTEFNPNEVDKKDLLKMGLNDFIVNNIINYRNAGGSFSTSKDLLKIYGMNEEIFKMMESHINIPPDEENDDAQNSKEAVDPVADHTAYNEKINSAAFIDLMQVEGMEARIAGRILKYRDLLGGYYSFDQLGEVYGMTDSTERKLREKFIVDTANITRFSLRDITYADLLRHPYIEKECLNDFFKLKEFYGDSLTTELILRNKIFPDSILKRILPYFPE